MAEGVLLRAGVAEGHVPELQGVAPRRVPRYVWCLLEAEGLFLLQELPGLGEVQGLLAEDGEVGEDAVDPPGKAADGGEVEQEGRGAEIPLPHLPDEPGVSRAVAGQGQKYVDEVRLDEDAALPLVEIVEEALRLSGDLLQPRGQAENAHVLGQLCVHHPVPGVVDALPHPVGLLPVAVAPAACPLGGEKAQDRRHQHHRHHRRVQGAQEHQPEDEGDEVLQQLHQDGPEVFGGGAVVIGGALGLLRPGEEAGVLGVGVGGAAELEVQIVVDAGAHLDAAEEGVLLEVVPAPGAEHQPSGEKADGHQQLPQGCALLHLPDHRRSGQELQEVQRHLAEDEGRRVGQDGHRVLRRPADHPPGHLEEVVFGLWGPVFFFRHGGCSFLGFTVKTNWRGKVSTVWGDFPPFF